MPLEDHMPADPSPSPLAPEERRQAHRMSPPRALVIHEAVREEGEAELRRPTASLIWSALAAGLSMGFSMVGMGVIAAALPPDTGWAPLVSSLGYSFGFLLVILGRQQLFTENTLTAVLPLLHDRKLPVLMGILRLWSIVLVMNLLGTILFAWIVQATDVYGPAVKAAFVALGTHAVAPDWGTTFAKAVMAGWLIALLVWTMPAAGAAKPFVVLAVTYLVALSALAHTVAGSVEVAYAAFAGAVGWDEYAAGFMLPTILGNIVGGVGLVALVNHAQVRSEMSSG